MDGARSWLESTKKRGMALGLKGTKSVLDRLGLTLPRHIIHVAGSNGKGTVSALMATALVLNDIDNVLFTSPHVDLTFFEVTYLVSIISSVGSEVLILETGLGGRLDATRSGPATASLVTAVSREHVDVLGSELSSIAREKAAISRPNCPLIIRDPEDEEVRQAMLLEALNAGNTMASSDAFTEQ